MMSVDETTTFHDTFTHRHVVLPVIHVESERQALNNIEIALSEGADGVFLINHSIGSDLLLDIHSAAADRFPEAWLGVNCLDLSAAEAFTRIPRRVNGVWADNAMIDEAVEQQSDAQRVLDAKRKGGSHALYFGGVAFKYQRQVEDLTAAARKAAAFMDVVTTSGPGTGRVAHVAKIKAMKQALGSFPLAIASGITPENIEDYLPHSDCYLVATGISDSFTELSPSRLKSLVRRVRSYEHCSAVDSTPRGPFEYRSVCFVCEWNEGRSVHLELSVRQKLRRRDATVETRSAGLSQGGGINSMRREYLAQQGIPRPEIEAHRSTVFGTRHADSDLVLVAEPEMKKRLLAEWPSLQGRIMTIRGFALGQSPENEALPAAEARIEDAGGHDDKTKLKLYAELEALAIQIARRLCQ